MKIKFTLLVIMLFAGILSTQAQQGGQKRTVEERVKLAVTRMNDSLKLSSVQLADVEIALSDYYKGQDKIREGLAPGARPERADVEKLGDIRDAKIKVFLTEPQYNRYIEMQNAMRKRANGQRPGGQ
ncbi:MAG: hypothetical protein WKF59_09355 [Chitinophagaceae bacterium]